MQTHGKQVIVDCPPDTDPVDAVHSAIALLQYAQMHTGQFSRKDLSALEYAETFARRVIE